MIARPHYEAIWREFDETKRLVLVSGPRQTGKTTLARALAAEERASVYFNYDIPANKAKLRENPTFFEEVDRGEDVLPLVILDEIHKYDEWKAYLKGIYDGYADSYRFLVTGSGRLDLFQQSGESLAGRYLQFHLFPFTMGERLSGELGRKADQRNLLEVPETDRAGVGGAWETLYRCGGFPEPFAAGAERSYRRWAQTYHRQIIREDIRDAFAVKKIDTMETLYELLVPRGGSLLSAAKLASQLRTSHNTIASWLDVFERFCLIFRVRPYSRSVSRSITKEPKFYFYDARRAEDDGARFENLVAVELKRATTLWTDYGLGTFDVRFVRNKEGQEVDFLVTRDEYPHFLVETKVSETTVAPSLRKFQTSLQVPAFQLVNRPGISRIIKNDGNQVLVVSAANWLAELG